MIPQKFDGENVRDINMTMMNWVVTRADVGLGRELALELLENDHRVFSLVKDYNKVTDLTSRFPNRFITVDFESSTTQTLQMLLSCLLEFTSKLDGVILSENFLLLGAVEESSSSEIFSAIDTGFTFPIMLIRSLISFLRINRNGRIIYISPPGMDLLHAGATVTYAMSFGLGKFINSLSDELAKFKIKTSVINIKNDVNSIFFGDMIISNLISNYDNSEARTIIELSSLISDKELKAYTCHVAKTISEYILGKSIVRNKHFCIN